MRAVLSSPMEPADGDGTTRIQFRLPNGNRYRRRFRLDEPVTTIFEVLSLTQQWPHTLVSKHVAAKDAFDVHTMHPIASIAPLAQAGQSIGEAGLANMSLTVVMISTSCADGGWLCDT